MTQVLFPVSFYISLLLTSIFPIMTTLSSFTIANRLSSTGLEPIMIELLRGLIQVLALFGCIRFGCVQIFKTFVGAHLRFTASFTQFLGVIVWPHGVNAPNVSNSGRLKMHVTHDVHSITLRSHYVLLIPNFHLRVIGIFIQVLV